MRKTILSLALMGLAFTTQAQEEKETPDFEFLEFKRAKFHLIDSDNRRLKSKLSNREMTDLLTDYPTARNYYNMYRTMHSLKVATRWIFIGTELVAIPFIFGNTDQSFETGTNIATAGILFALAVHLPISIMAGSKAGKVKENYNYQMKKEREKYSLGIGATKNGIGLVVNF